MNSAEPNWHEKVAEIWATAQGRDPDEVLAQIEALVAGHERDPLAAFELAGAYDFAGQEDRAEAPYRRALSGGLDPEHHQQAVIQLASTLRNLGRATEAADLLWAELDSTLVAPYAASARAFLALTLLDLGDDRRAAVVALEGLRDSLSEYAGPVGRYLDDVTSTDVDDEPEDEQPQVFNG
ncbi:tetratricopeptide repeat protein [Occultella glacieicola]|uniref:Tetratricopeptide repeat protein n=1 Tax=Occultella glacieicola TaxID=2518684 RepID=A0ABY2DXF8_9MICO|nr:tetratricopeptide repeat protein [Occultella glacieicola]TDE88824.1 tetratricopeptide repeat protein [Occultella glacieicola]